MKNNNMKNNLETEISRGILFGIFVKYQYLSRFSMCCCSHCSIVSEVSQMLSMTTRGKAQFVLQLLHKHRGTSLPPWGKQRIPTTLNEKGKISLLLVPTSG